METSITKLVVFGILTRFVYYIWMVVSSSILPPYDLQTYLLSDTVSPFLAPFSSWDGVHFLSIAMKGYIHEHQHAFFPLFPYFVRTVTHLLGFAADDANGYIFIGVLISLVSFNIALVTLYKMTKDYSNEDFAYKTGILFCVAPASVFLTSAYTESLYGCLSLLACYFLYNKKNVMMSCLFFFVASFVRSNGLINLGFVLYYFVDNILPFASFPKVHKKVTVRLVVSTVLLVISNLLPFVLYDHFAAEKFCNMTPKPTYCGGIGKLYSYIQARYWNQGFLKYWRLIEIPNFLLCAPAVIISLIVCGYYLVNYFIRHPLFRSLCKSTQLEESKSDTQNGKGMKNNDLLVYFVHLLALVVFGLFCMHTQVITRFVSACPAFYWGIVWITQQKVFGMLRYVPVFYSVFYTFFGGVMFASFYPWT
ncbi:GPI mannosyltransferase, putative [Entamoeba invadens IP1]|uniref:GPI mannosyltransferase 2 n=2 Tax=Entamoeba invadens TaxID=33085 RepID=L7FJW9_ENTIV|nr:GPI mannosyltransferase, putative [Entamoeba invadens IP1]ELP84840.1 GPI mannosyltransferase, putative [Entamoeba invadens IP1]BAN40344.1 GPI mannosyltransferase, putative [Entamoeba invadens]|eukprot:XP_004184186.1 GPI mannosyltransferase, putative [Entamoeba invadens IP1]